MIGAVAAALSAFADALAPVSVIRRLGGAATKSSAKIAPNGEFSAKTAPDTTAKTVPTATPAAEAAITAADPPKPMLAAGQPAW